jgi:LCP family protein required for cell wall assembly
LRIRRKSGSAGRTVTLIIFSVVFTLVFLGFNFVYGTFSSIYNMKFRGSNIKGSTLDFSKRINMLLVGVDAPYLEDHARSDTMMIISFNPANRKIYILSIARDTWIAPPWLGYSTKINAINNPDFCDVCGTEKLIETIEWLTEIKIDCYMKTNFRGFAQIIDVLGGVDIDVEKDMDYDEPLDNTHIHLKQGLQHLNGQKALEYVRFRKTDADWQIDLEGKPAGRVARQANFIKSIFKELLKFENILKFQQVINIIQNNIETNLDVPNGISLLFKFQDLMKGATTNNVVVLTWWGEDDNIETGEKEYPVLSIVNPNIKKIREQCKEFMSDEPKPVKPNP